MWWTQPKQASSATMSIVYITVGALMDVWTVIYYVYLNRHGGDDTTYLWVYGFFFSGIVLMFIGLALGWIGRAAKQAEVAAPPPIVTSNAAVPAATIVPQPAVAAGVPAVPAVPAAPAPAPSVASTPRR